VLPNDKPVRGEQHCQSFYTQPTDSLSQLIPMENPGEKFATNRILWVSTFFLQISHADFFLYLCRHFQEINGEIRYFHDVPTGWSVLLRSNQFLFVPGSASP